MPYYKGIIIIPLQKNLFVWFYGYICPKALIWDFNVLEYKYLGVYCIGFYFDIILRNKYLYLFHVLYIYIVKFDFKPRGEMIFDKFECSNLFYKFGMIVFFIISEIFQAFSHKYKGTNKLWLYINIFLNLYPKKRTFKYILNCPPPPSLPFV